MTASALEGIRVLDLSEGIPGPFCAYLLAHFGATVLKVEPPAGDLSRRLGPFPNDVPDIEKSGLFLFLNSAKEGCVLDISAGNGRKHLKDIVAAADVVIEDAQRKTLEKAGISEADIRDINPALIRTSISPFGESGPYKDFPASDLTVAAMSGFLLGTGDPDKEPLSGCMSRTDYVSGYMAYIGTLTALRARRKIFAGQKVEVSALESMIAVTEHVPTFFSYNGTIISRIGNRRTTVHPAGIYACKDGFVQTYMLREDQWQRFCDVIGRPDLPEDERFKRNRDRVIHADEIDAILNEWFAKHGKLEIEQLCQANRVPVSMVANPKDLIDSEHLAARNFWITADDPSRGSKFLPGAPFKLPASPWQHKHDAPMLNTNASPQNWSRVQAQPAQQTEESGKPLAGLRIIDLTAAWAGPLCARVLAYFGAEVIKIESPARPDLGRGEVSPRGFLERYPDKEYGERPWNRNLYFNSINHNKRSVSLDLSNPRGLAVARALVAKSDAIVENFSARVMDKLGLGYGELTKINPEIILLSMPGFGLTGPKRDWIAWGSTVEAGSGLANQIGYSAGRPFMSGMTFNDPFTGLAGAAALLTALSYREGSGIGQHIDLSHQETAITLIGDVMMDFFMNGRLGGPARNRHRWLAPQGVYRCKGDDRWLAISIESDQQWKALAECIGRAEWAVDPAFASDRDRMKRHDEIDRSIGEWSRNLQRDEAWKILIRKGIPAGPAFTGEDILRDQHLAARKFLREMAHPDCGKRIYSDLGPHLSVTPGSTDTVSPPFGADNDYVFKEILNLPPAEIDTLYAEGIASREPIRKMVA